MLLINQINNMKSPKCDACKFEAQGETLTIGLNQCMHTYAAEHADLMKAMEGKPKEEGEKWMAEAKLNLMQHKQSIYPN